MEQGLTSAQVATLLKSNGPNTITTDTSFSAIKLLISQFNSVINLILFLAAIFSMLLHDVLDGVFIFIVILINAALGFWQEYKAEKSLQELSAYVVAKARVIRDGREQMVDTSQLVPGDVVILGEGDRIPADGKLLSSQGVEIDEGILTGESLPVEKEKDHEVFLGTLLLKGKGQLQVIQTGKQTRFGQIAQTLTSIENDKTPLQKQLTTVGKVLSAAALGIAFLIIPIGVWQHRPLLELVLIAITIGIAAVPEGLPTVVTIALALGTLRMAKQRAIIRKMPAVETLGSVSTIIVDKTGTLTQNSMRVKKFWTVKNESLAHLLKACVLGNTASLIAKTTTGEYEIAGDRTDGALLMFAKQEKEDIQKDVRDGKIIDEFVFDTDLKTISTTWQQQGKTHLFVRGAPEMILEKSTTTKKEKEAIEKQISSYAQEGYRVIAFASRDVSTLTATTREKLEQDLHFLGIVGIYDPPRIEVKEALEKARNAGIHVIMVTGDNEKTALAIAKEIGLVSKNETVLTSEALSRLSDQELIRLIPRTTVFARATPQDKMRLVSVLQSQGIVVGVTGDGVNDALALKKADVGVAMGESGTEVAKEASDIVLTDDNFATLMKAVEEGRTIYHNIIKAIMYLLTSNLSELSLVFFATLLGLPEVLLPIQILWINIVTDVLPALSLAIDNKDHRVLLHKPRDPSTPILTRERLLFMLSVGICIAWLLLGGYSYLLLHVSETLARTIIFNALVFSHLLLALFLRGQSLFNVNKLLLFSILLTILLQIVITTTPAFQAIFHLGLQ
ncbi:calcium-translocating P-type ATPase, SERCA-type [soil metagenome]